MTQAAPISITTGALPSSQKIYVKGALHPQIQVAMREITLSPTAAEAPLRVYDTSGSYSDPQTTIDIRKGLAKLRHSWITARGDVETYTGRDVKPEDNGLKIPQSPTALELFPQINTTPLRAKKGQNVTQLAYARTRPITSMPK